MNDDRVAGKKSRPSHGLSLPDGAIFSQDPALGIEERLDVAASLLQSKRDNSIREMMKLSEHEQRKAWQHGFLIVGGILFFSWPLVSIAAESSVRDLYVYLFVGWAIFVALIFVAALGLGDDDLDPSKDDGEPHHD